MKETGDPGQKKQDARPRCPPLRFEEGVVGWKMGDGGWGWKLAEGTAFTLGGEWGTRALPLVWPQKRSHLDASLEAAGVRGTVLKCSILSSNLRISKRRDECSPWSCVPMRFKIDSDSIPRPSTPPQSSLP